jgi:hypothetical protein
LDKIEVMTHKAKTASSNPPDDQTKAQAEALIKKGQDASLSTPDKSTTNTTRKQPYTEIGIPIKWVTPLNSSRGNPNIEVIFIENLTPISVEEIPPSEFFYNKKRKVVVKRETHQKEGSTVKRHRVLYDVQASEEA